MGTRIVLEIRNVITNTTIETEEFENNLFIISAILVQKKLLNKIIYK